MKVAVFGLGYVGAVTAACLAQRGHTLIGVDVNPQKCEMIASGRSPIVEEGLDDLLLQGVQAGRLRTTTDVLDAVREADLSIVSVGTPSQPNGALDLSYVYRVCEQIGEALAETGRPHVVVLRSTALPGTTETCLGILREAARGTDVHVAFNPEFLREGSSIRDFDAPAYTIIGSDDPVAEAALRELYADVPAPLIVVAPRVAEMVKYTANAFHALKITFANEIGLLAKAMGVDGREVMNLIVQDTKLNISPAYLRPGFAYGGSCLPKDVSALLHLARREEVPVPLLASLPQSNRSQIERVAEQVLATGARRVTVLGLAFKAGTDDLRESPAVELVERLIGKGCEVRILDRAVQTAKLLGANKEYIERRLPHVSRLLTDDPEELVHDAQAVVVTQNLPEFARILEGVGPDVPVFDVASLKGAPAHLQVHGVAW
ncbi:UDP-glucose dehydrogenase family protein [Deinococcus planocerae]|uniref:UDP-glucose dehydrogenase family protein n=1 Tax=Deinococcus planocerae TaxID=1737569 RepID=UPI000C7EA473|nr:UDP-glucose/GDP-mannose dehydrogenase family protein [Deinococcus planocerae]